MFTYIKRAIFSFFPLFFFLKVSHAQNDMIQRLEPEKKSSYGIGIVLDGGITIPFTDVQQKQTAAVFGIGVNYAVLPFLKINFDLQKGNLEEGRKKIPNYIMNYRNRYFYTALTTKVKPVDLLNVSDGSRTYLGITAGLGLAVIFNNVDAAPLENKTYGYIENYRGANILIPIEIGYSIPVYQLPESNQGLSININLRRHLSFTDKLDGYVPSLASNKKKDVFVQLTFGLQYSF